MRLQAKNENNIRFANNKYCCNHCGHFDKNIEKVIEHCTTHEIMPIKNPIQNLYKMLMNTSYGKTIIKPQATGIKVFNSEEEVRRYAINNTNQSIKYWQIGTKDKYMLETRNNILDHSNYPHVGSLILSMSKKIMNKVIYAAEDNDIKILYTDTDSMHLEQNKVDKLRKIHKQKYGGKLIGNSMGQFHSDFSSSKAQKGFEIVSDVCYIIAPKVYYDKLIVDDQGTNDYHYKMKGIPQKCIQIRGEEIGEDVEAVYRGLFNYEEQEFDILKGVDVKLNKNKNQEIIERTTKFVRRVKMQKYEDTGDNVSKITTIKK